MTTIYRDMVIPARRRYTFTPDDVWALTVANKYTAGLTDLELSLKKFGYNYKIHGIGEPWEGFRSKIRWYNEILATLPDTALVVTMDAFDALMAGPPERIIEEWSKCTNPIMIGAEDDCQDPGVCHVPRNIWLQRGKDSHMPYVNSGVIIGPVEYIRWIFKMAYLGPDSDDDQRAMGHLADRHTTMFDLDHRQRCIGNMRLPLFHRYDYDDSSQQFVFHGPKERTHPVIIHTIGLWLDGTNRHKWAGKHILGDQYVEHEWGTIWQGFKGRAKLGLKRKPVKAVPILILLIMYYKYPKLWLTLPPIAVITYIMMRH